MPAEGPLDLDRHRKPSARDSAISSAREQSAVACLSRTELASIADLCQRHDSFVSHDEIYEHIFTRATPILYRDAPGDGDRTITISVCVLRRSSHGLRIGTIGAPPDVTGLILSPTFSRSAHPPAPDAVAVALETLGDDYYQDGPGGLLRRRDNPCAGLL